ncbi:gluconokinase [Maribacter sp. 2-571]|uniref:gluconokinase n=1 Tax=Maribacter sp. 2-571 TaxID=3417569 RepID=UPI003D35248C
MNVNKILFVMGVSGSGKSTVGRALAEKLQIPFFDGDDYHPAANVTKMAKGIPLDDADRHGWLIALNKLAMNHKMQGAVIACSALKKTYRKLLTDGMEHYSTFVFLEGSFETIEKRMKARKDHFMPTDLLRSQFDTLEPPLDAITVSISQPVESMVAQVMYSI